MCKCIKDYLLMGESLAIMGGFIFAWIQIRQQARISRANHDRQIRISQADHDRRKKQSTIEFYDSLSTDSYKIWEDIGDKTLDLSIIHADPALKRNIRIYLARLERLAIGVASNVYDFNILNLMCGKYLIDKYNKLERYIGEVRLDGKNQMYYKEFELLIKKLEKRKRDNPNETVESGCLRVEQPFGDGDGNQDSAGSPKKTQSP